MRLKAELLAENETLKAQLKALESQSASAKAIDINSLGEISFSNTFNGVAVRAYQSATKGYHVAITKDGKSAVKRVSGPSEAHVVVEQMRVHPDNFL